MIAPSFNRFIHKKAISLPFPSKNISMECTEFNITHYQADFFSHHNISIPKTISQSVNKRQAEFFAGRYTAQLALKKLNITCDDIPIGENRAPVFPNTVNASITHTNTTALCAAALPHNYQFLGVDIEDVILMSTIHDIKNTVIFNDEITLLEQSILSIEQAFTLAFSAKESLFKALYPHVGHYFDFSAAKLIEISPDNHRFTLVLTEDLTTKLCSGKVFNGYFSFIDKNHVLTLVAQ
ncbi:4'-phosphopantetheinyl transferase superfamily protein [Alteromonas sp. 5E99-2]|uniref:4'-phosphopantetheinyl transferase family protein n=1 Tax=Alteromonas sp. 5E99-2 TaxID=2817683 RepID=UPI001A99BAB4|nr:4'-phosphopantetheinyl transferase superfamily protein [Alteromonas sp. 5E99-2]